MQNYEKTGKVAMDEKSIQEITRYNFALYESEYAIGTALLPSGHTEKIREQRQRLEHQLRVEIATLRDMRLPWPGMPETPKHDPMLVDLFEIQTRRPPAYIQSAQEVIALIQDDRDLWPLGPAVL